MNFAGIIAFIFSDLVVFPVLRIQAQYYGWKMAFYILAMFLIVLVLTAWLMHFGFSLMGLLPDAGEAKSVTEREFFKVDYTLFLNSVFLLMSAVFVGWNMKDRSRHSMGDESWTDTSLFWLAVTAYIWLAGGLLAGVR